MSHDILCTISPIRNDLISSKEILSAQGITGNSRASENRGQVHSNIREIIDAKIAN
jgi:hypothetical protein